MRIGIILFSILIISTTSSFSHSQIQTDYPLQTVPYTDVEIIDDFWTPRREINREVSLPHCFQMYEETGELASPKMIEGAAYMLAKKPDIELEEYVNSVIDQTIKEVESRIKKNPESTVKISGHFFEAAVEYHKATGNRKMLNAALKVANVIDSLYGPNKKTYISHHEWLKIGLIKLYRYTGNQRYLNLARFFLHERGKEDYKRTGEYAKYRTYNQDHKPVIEQSKAVGHCVRATFLYIAMTDVAALTGDEVLVKAVDRIWKDAVYNKTYLTGGIGSVRFHEKYGDPYHLPNLNSWNETCAAYGNAVWNHRLFLLHRQAKYIDLMERILYNAWLVGVSLKGNRFFYQNPLKSFGNYERFRWINVPCCPPNIVRLMASLEKYIYAKSKNDIYVNLFIASTANIKLNNSSIHITQKTQYPWEGKVKMIVELEQSKKFNFFIRIPLWTRNQPMPGDLYHYQYVYDDSVIITVNEKPVEYEMEKGFARLEREWKQGDVIELDIPMPVRKVHAHKKIKDNRGRVALERGPLVYCAEAPDNKGNVLNLLVQNDAVFKSEYCKDLLGGISIVKGKVLAISRGKNQDSVLQKPHKLVAIPYFSWANRGKKKMTVWLAGRSNRIRLKPVPPEPINTVSSRGKIEKKWTGYNDQNDAIESVYDGKQPLHSLDESNLYFRMRSPEGKPVWIQYDFKHPTQVSSSKVYWVDDKRFCKLPESWRLLYKKGKEWIPVHNHQPYKIKKDTFNFVTFDSLRTTAIRLEIIPQSILYRAGHIGPPAALFIDRDVVWRECGVIEWRIE